MKNSKFDTKKQSDIEGTLTPNPDAIHQIKVGLNHLLCSGV